MMNVEKLASASDPAATAAARDRMPYCSWSILELMGHRQRAGLVTEVEIAGGKLLRIDIPAASRDDGTDVTVTEFYGVSSIYSLRPCTEEIARDWCHRYSDDIRPLRPAEYRDRPRLSHPDHDDEPEHIDEGDDADE